MYGLDREEYRNWIGTADGSCTDSGDGSHILCDGGVSVGWTGWRLIRFILVPAVGFVIVTLFRKVVGAKRPYEIYDFTPLLNKDTKANSFPSRHVFSNMIIAAAVFWINLPLGVATGSCGVALAVFRVITGVHFPKDVAAGAVIAVLFGWIGFYLI